MRINTVYKTKTTCIQKNPHVKMSMARDIANYISTHYSCKTLYGEIKTNSKNNRKIYFFFLYQYAVHGIVVVRRVWVTRRMEKVIYLIVLTFFLNKC